MAELRVPKLNNNDTEYLLVEWLVPDGARVHEDDVVALMETSKAAEELPADSSGVIRHVLKAGTWCHPDDILATVTPPGQPPEPPTTGHLPPATEDRLPGPQPLITAPAQALIDELGITPGQLATLDVAVVRRSDVEALAEQPRVHQFTRVQRAVARAVELSHQSIPAAYTVVRMDLGPALAHAGRLTKEIRRPVGLAEVFVQAVAGLHEDYPLFFARIDGTRALLADRPDIGVTVDLGEGLYVPVVHDAAALTTKEVASKLMRHRLAASTGEFAEADLTGATFVLTLHTELGVVLAIPFIFPGTVCALAVTAPHDGTLANIGLAYDHRLINGRDAALFLNALRAAVEGLT